MKTVSVELSSVKNIKEKSLLVVTIGRYTIGRYTIVVILSVVILLVTSLCLLTFMETSEMTLGNCGRSRNFHLTVNLNIDSFIRKLICSTDDTRYLDIPGTLQKC